MAEQLGWREAIIQVLTESPEPMHYDASLNKSNTHNCVAFGATPANTVNVTISTSIAKEGAKSIFERVGRGVYRMRAVPIAGPLTPKAQVALAEEVAEKEALLADDMGAGDSAGLINAFGMYWSRDRVIWGNEPKLLGKQSASSDAVNFTEQRGVYLLYDATRPFMSVAQSTKGSVRACGNTRRIA